MTAEIDDFGRFTLYGLRARVRRKLHGIRTTLDASGNESAITQLDPLLSNEDLNVVINTAIVKRCIDLGINDDSILADEVLVDIKTNVVEYELPEDLLFVRGLYYKDPTTTYTTVPPNDRVAMVLVDDYENVRKDSMDVPTYKLRLNMLVLNWVPEEDNLGGILVDYVKWLNPLLSDDAVLETQLARVLQEVIIYDAAIDLMVSKLHLDSTELRASLQAMEERLLYAIRGVFTPKSVQLRPAKPLIYYDKGVIR
jgi:hypothetical protein